MIGSEAPEQSVQHTVDPKRLIITLFTRSETNRSLYTIHVTELDSAWTTPTLIQSAMISACKTLASTSSHPEPVRTDRSLCSTPNNPPRLTLCLLTQASGCVVLPLFSLQPHLSPFPCPVSFIQQITRSPRVPPPFTVGFSQFAVFRSGKPHSASPRRHHALTPRLQWHFPTGSFSKAVVIEPVLDKYTVPPNSGVLQLFKKKKR